MWLRECWAYANFSREKSPLEKYKTRGKHKIKCSDYFNSKYAN